MAPKMPEGLFLKRRFISTSELSREEEIERALLVGKAMKEISERDIKKTSDPSWQNSNQLLFGAFHQNQNQFRDSREKDFPPM